MQSLFVATEGSTDTDYSGLKLVTVSFRRDKPTGQGAQAAFSVTLSSRINTNFGE